MSESEPSAVSESESGNHSRAIFASVTLLVISSTLPYTSFLPTMLAYGFVLTSYIILGYVALTFKRETTIALPTWALITLSVIWAIYLGHLYFDAVAGNVTINAFIRVPIFIILTGFNLFYIPLIVPRRTFFGILARVAAVLVLIGIPTLFVESYGIGSIEITRWRGSTPIPLTSIRYHVITSIFTNPNTLSYVTMVGFLSACGEFVNERQFGTKWLIAINATGLYFSHSRSAMLAAIVGLSMFGAYFLVKQRTFEILFLLGNVSGAIAIFMLLDLLPSPNFLSSIDLAGRKEIWTGTVRAVASQPLFGFGTGHTERLIAPFVVEEFAGLGPHNSYLRVFVETGIVGGVAHLLFVTKTLLVQLVANLDRDGLTTFILCSAVAIAMIFSGFMLFGISVTSITAAILFGYGLKGA